MPRELEAGKVWLERHGRCTSCPTSFEGKAAFMVFGKVAWGAPFEGGFSCHTNKWAPFCEDCATIEEAAIPRTESVCDGCGLRMLVPTGYAIETCSRACYQRIARKANRLKQCICEVCKQDFVTSRADSKFCSAACRQWAYRRRKA
jgi:hypothetical protein